MADTSLDIDIDNLHKECQQQAGLFHKYAEKLASAKSDLDSAKSRLDVCEAEIARDIRKSPEKFGIGKLTESVVKETIPLQQEYQDSVAEVTSAKYAVAILEAKTSALEHKKRMLEILVPLWLNDYWAEPRSPKGEDREKLEEVTKKRVMAKGQNRRKE
jgi:hypothetical protein